MKLPLSLLVLTLNEAKTLPFCLAPLKDHVSEILVCDTGSADGTPRIAKRHGATVFFRPPVKDGRLDRARNFLIEKAAQPWILFIDADEQIARKSIPLLRALILRPKADTYYFPRRNYSDTLPVLYEWHPCRREYPREERFSRCHGYYETPRICLFRNQPRLRYEVPVHDSLLPAIQRHGICIQPADLPIHHFEFHKGMGHHIEKHRFYAKILKRLIRRVPAYTPAYFSVVRDLIASGSNPKETLRFAQRLTAKASHSDDAWTLRGVVEMEAGRYLEAEAHFKKAIRLEKSARNLCLLGWLYLKKGDYSLSEKILKESLGKSPLQPLTLNLLGIARERTGEIKKALRSFSEAGRIHPGYAESFYNQAVIRGRLGDLRGSRKNYERSRQLFSAMRMWRIESGVGGSAS
ncbi:MAG: glycosyltransferase [Candidatus Omnitrophota bacterium]|nr:glycosyltransferase [Candidatus Omnitrophota bacterium]